MVACHSSKVSLLFDQAEKAPSLKMLIKLDGAVTEEETQRSNETGITIRTMEEVEVSVVTRMVEGGGFPFFVGL